MKIQKLPFLSFLKLLLAAVSIVAINQIVNIWHRFFKPSHYPNVTA